MDTIILEKSERQEVAAQGEGYSKSPGYTIWINYGETNNSFYLGYIEEDKLDTAIWFYSKEDDLAIVVIDGDKQVRVK